MADPNRDRLGGKAIRDYFFRPVPAKPGIWVCKCNTERKEGRGYTNFVSHVQAQHPEALHLLQCDDDGRVSTRSSTVLGDNLAPSLFHSSKAVKTHASIDLVVSGLLPFSVLNNALFKEYLVYASFNTLTCLKYIRKLTKFVEEKISQIFPERFALIVDGWTASSTHYFGVFASFLQKKQENMKPYYWGSARLKTKQI